MLGDRGTNVNTDRTPFSSDCPVARRRGTSGRQNNKKKVAAQGQGQRRKGKAIQSSAHCLMPKESKLPQEETRQGLQILKRVLRNGPT